MNNNLIYIPPFLNDYSNNELQIINCSASEYARCATNAECGGILGCSSCVSGCQTNSECGYNLTPSTPCWEGCSTNAECGQCDSCERSSQSCGSSEESCGGYGCMGGCQSCENSCQTTCQINSQGCSSCQSTCQTTCEANCQDFCENNNQNIGIYTNNESQQVVKINNIQVGKDNKKNSILQAYAGINNEIKLIYDAIDNIVGIAIVANGIFNTDNSGVKNTTAIEKYQWQGGLGWESTYNRLTLYNNIASSGAGLEGKIYFKLNDGTYIDNEEIIKMLFTYHKFTLEVYNDVSSSSRGSNTIFGKVFADNENFILTKDTMLNLNFSLSIWYSASYESNFRIKTATLDGRNLSIEFFDKTPELPYYANVNNIEKAVIKINTAYLDSGVTNYGDNYDGTTIATGRDAYQTWITTYGSVDLSTSNTYSYCRIYHNSGSSNNGYVLDLYGDVYIKYKNGALKYINDASLKRYFTGTCKMQFDDGYSGSAYYAYSSYYLNNDSTNMLTTKTFDYPSQISNSMWYMSFGRYRSSGSAYIRSYFYNLQLNNIGLPEVSIPTEFEINSAWL